MRSAPSLAALDTGGIDNGPVVVYDQHNGTAVMLSPASNPMVADHALVEATKAWAWGIGGEVVSIPPDYSHDVMFVTGSTGIADTIDTWGLNLQRCVACCDEKRVQVASGG